MQIIYAHTYAYNICKNMIYAKVICDHSHNLSLDILLMWVTNSTIYFWIELYLGRLSVIHFNYSSFFSGFQLLHTYKNFWNDSILLLQSWCLCLPKTNMSKFFPHGVVSGDEIFGRPLSYKVEALSVTGVLKRDAHSASFFPSARENTLGREESLTSASSASALA